MTQPAFSANPATTKRASLTRRYLTPLTFLVVLTLASALASANTQAPPAAKIQQQQNALINAFNFDWQFTNVPPASADKLPASDAPWRTVQLPHDWSIESAPGRSPFYAQSPDQFHTGYARAGTGWYKKSFPVDSSLRNKRFLLEFGGIYLNSDIYLNGQRIGGQHNGYTSFIVDLTPEIKTGENLLAVRVNNTGQNSRWYTGSGIYRPVKLHINNLTDFTPWGTQVRAQVGKQTATVFIATQIEHEPSNNQPAILLQEVIAPGNQTVAAQTFSLNLEHGENRFEHSLKVPDPALWAPDAPHLYRLRQTLHLADSANEMPGIKSTTFGIRTLQFSPEKGFSINQKPMLLQGLNMHHDNYMLGAAAYQRAEERKVERVLAAGYNAVRTAHNPPSQAFLAAADRLGLLVINEAFDVWNRAKGRPNDYASHFDNNWRKDLTGFMQRDYNHPSVIMWSLGNEIPEQNEAAGINTAKAMVALAKRLDPTRPITIGANTAGAEGDPFLDQFDVVGYNYQKDHYLSDHKDNPRRIMYGSESYIRDAFEYWQYVKEQPFIIGDFVWTGWDYLGEAGIGWTGWSQGWKALAPYPWHLAYSGELDVLGNKKASGYYRDVLWQTGKNPLTLFVESPQPTYQPAPDPGWILRWTSDDLHPSWTWPGHKGQELPVTVYSIYDQVELTLNGKSLGIKNNAETNQWKTRFSVAYEPGELMAHGYDIIDDKPMLMARTALKTSAPASNIHLTTDRSTFRADGQDLIYVTARLTDKNNNPTYHFSHDITLDFNVEGPASIVGIGNANPTSEESFNGSTRSTHHGTAVAVIRSQRNTPGPVTVTVSSAPNKSEEEKIKTAMTVYSVAPSSVSGD